MTDLREKLARHLYESGASERFFREYHNVPTLDPERDLADAIIAALPGMVKPLEWWHEDGSTDDLCSNYRIWDAGRGDWMMVSYSGPAPTRHYVGPSRDEAISAANAYHRTAIMAALGVEGE